MCPLKDLNIQKSQSLGSVFWNFSIQWSEVPFPRYSDSYVWTFESGCSAIATYKTYVFSKSSNVPILNFFLVIPDTFSIPKSLTEVMGDLIFLKTRSRPMWLSVQISASFYLLSLCTIPQARECYFYKVDCYRLPCKKLRKFFCIKGKWERSDDDEGWEWRQGAQCLFVELFSSVCLWYPVCSPLTGALGQLPQEKLHIWRGG